MQRAQRVGPALVEQAEIGGANLGREQRVVEPALGLVDVPLGRHHVEIAGQHDRVAGRDQFGGVGDQAVEPAQLVVEFRPGARIAIGEVEAGNQHAVDRGLDIAAMAVVRIPR